MSVLLEFIRCQLLQRLFGSVSIMPQSRYAKHCRKPDLESKQKFCSTGLREGQPASGREVRSLCCRKVDAWKRTRGSLSDSRSTKTPSPPACCRAALSRLHLAINSSRIAALTSLAQRAVCKPYKHTSPPSATCCCLLEAHFCAA